MTTNNDHTHDNYDDWKQDRDRYAEQAVGLLNEMTGWLRGASDELTNNNAPRHAAAFVHHYGPRINEWAATYPTLTDENDDR